MYVQCTTHSVQCTSCTVRTFRVTQSSVSHRVTAHTHTHTVRSFVRSRFCRVDSSLWSNPEHHHSLPHTPPHSLPHTHTLFVRPSVRPILSIKSSIQNHASARKPRKLRSFVEVVGRLFVLSLVDSSSTIDDCARVFYAEYAATSPLVVWHSVSGVWYSSLRVPVLRQSTSWLRARLCFALRARLYAIANVMTWKVGFMRRWEVLEEVRTHMTEQRRIAKHVETW